MKKAKLILLAMALVLLLCGCYDNNETDNLVYATALGVDKGTDNNYSFTIQYARVFEINTGSEGGESGADILNTMTVEAPTVYSAVSLANHTISKQFVLSHLKLIVFSEELARDGLGEFVDVMMRSDEIRPHIYMAVSRDSAKNYLESVKPSIEINPIKYYQLIYDGKYSAYIPEFDNVELCFYHNSPEHDVVLPVASAVSEPEENEEGTQNIQLRNESFEYRLKNYIAGDFKRESKNPSEIMGMAIFNGDNLADFAGGVETELYNLLCGNFKMNYTTFEDKNTGEAVTVRLEQAQRPKMSIDISGEVPKINIKLYLEGELLGMPDGSYHDSSLTDFENDVKSSIESASEAFIKRIQKEYKSDILGTGSVLKRKFLTHSEFEQYNWEEKYQTAEFNIETEFDIRRTGQIIRGDI